MTPSDLVQKVTESNLDKTPPKQVKPIASLLKKPPKPNQISQSLKLEHINEQSNEKKVVPAGTTSVNHISLKLSK